MDRETHPGREELGNGGAQALQDTGAAGARADQGDGDRGGLRGRGGGRCRQRVTPGRVGRIGANRPAEADGPDHHAVGSGVNRAPG
ncbi:hypothetical protein STVIR_6136 [Streptomyces viridochromogenes Tue57]|uniref:Uncharacterized protein n=1 Tax=Streptomyces viridochromogenes Tue57 TaxID=1160705 RepID=L8P5T8_STRVR|nr:hypothetical protein STVIR_6136 [Streptomyces viridochromogenes Tue57]